MSYSKKDAFNFLNSIAFERMGGTSEELLAAEIIKKEAETSGFEAEILPFTIDDGTVFCAEFEVLEPYQKTYKVTGYKCCQSTPEQGIVCDFAYVENGTDVDLADVKGKIVLFNGYLRLPLFKSLIKSGAAAIVSFAGTLLNSWEENDHLTRKYRDLLLHFGNLPAVHMDINDAFEIVKNKASKARLKVLGECTKLTSHNVALTIKGTKYPEEIIAVGAHFDSTEFSKGVYDNGAGSAIIMEMMHYFAKNPALRTLKFIWFGSEELGLLGSHAYVDSLSKEELEKHIFMFNVDVGASVLGYNGCHVTASKEFTAYCDGFMKAHGHNVAVKQSIHSSDSTPFANKDIPGLNFFRNAAEGAAFIHSSHDTMDYLSEDGLDALFVPAMSFAKELFTSYIFPVERSIPSEIREDIDKYLYKKELEENDSKKSV